MRTSLRVGLGASALLAAGALWLDRAPQAPNLVEAVVPQRTPLSVAAMSPAQPLPPLPAFVPRLAVSAAQRDVFMPPQAPAPPAPKPLPVAQAPVAPVAAPPVPPAPAVTYRFLGRMRTPEGQVLTLLQRDDKPVTLSVGLTLDDGYVVQAIEPHAVRLFYPPTSTVVELPIPAGAESGSGW